jgi:hypothetical protein
VTWQTRHYQYAVCAKEGGSAASGAESKLENLAEDYSISPKGHQAASVF